MIDIELIKTTFEFALSSGVAVTGWKWLEKFYKNKRIEKSTKSLTNMALIYDHLNYMATELETNRCMLMYISNGGGLPSVAKNIYFTILYEVKDTTCDAVRSHFQNVLVDEEHTFLLNRVLHDTLVIEDAKNLKDSFLKSFFESQGIEKFVHFEVLRTPERFYYLSLNWSDASKMPTMSEIKTICQSSATNIKNILAKG